MDTRTTTKKCSLALVAVIAFISGQAVGANAFWLAAVGEGSYTNTVNWKDGFFPGASDTGFFDLGSGTPSEAGEFRVSFEGEIKDYNRICVRAVKEDVPLVFAVTNGATWYKGPGSFQSYQSGFSLCQDVGQTGDNLSIRSTSANTVEPCFLMSDALLSYTVNKTKGNRIEFSQGSWNWYDPSGVATESPNTTMYVGYGNNGEVMPYDGLCFSVAENATLRGRNLVVSQFTMDVAGGEHEMFGLVKIGNMNKGKDSLFRLRGGSLDVQGGLTIGAAASTARSSNNVATDTLSLSGAAQMNVASTVTMSEQKYALSRIVLENSSVLTISGALTIGLAAEVANLALSGDMSSYVCVKDAACLKLANNASSPSIYGPNAVIELMGGSSVLPQPYLFGTKAGAHGDCRLKVSGGTHYFGRGQSASESWNLSPSVGRLAGAKAIFEQTDGSVVLGNASFMFFADGGSSVASTGRCEIIGGTFKGKLRGGTAAACRGGKGHAEFYANGGTLQVIGAADAAYISDFDDAVLGPKGLTFYSHIESESGRTPDQVRVTINQAFTDQPGNVGRVIKTGVGISRFLKTSTHGETVIADGTCYFAEGVTQFGRSIVVTNGAALHISGNIVAERLSLGDATGTQGTIVVPEGAVVTLTADDALSSPSGRLDYAPAAVKGVYTVFRLTGNVDESAFLRLGLVQTSSTLRHGFQFVEDGTDTLVQVVAYGSEDIKSVSWQGASSDFLAPENWSDAATPGMTNAVVFPSASSVKEITLEQQATVESMTFEGGAFGISGGGLLQTHGISLLDGAANVMTPLFTMGLLSIDVGENGVLSLGGLLDGRFLAQKTGKGKLAVLSDDSTAVSDWELLGGTSEFSSPNALGIGSGTLTVGCATVTFTGAGESGHSITIDPGADQAAVLCAVENVRFDGGVDANSGGWMKTGAGALTVNYPSGRHYLAKSDLDLGRNAAQGNDSKWLQPVPDDGEVVSTDGMGGFTVREGLVRLSGCGANETTVRMEHPVLVGGKWTNDIAEAVLEIANLTFDNAGTDYRRPQIGLRPFGSCVHPTIRICENAAFNVQGLLIGGDGGKSVDGGTYPTFEITNATSTIGSSLYVGQDGKAEASCHPTVRIWKDADVNVASSSLSLGVMLGANADVLVDGGTLRSSTDNAGILFSYCSSGGITVKNGGLLKIPGIKSTGADYSVPSFTTAVILDGGVLELTKSREDVIVSPDRRWFTLGMAGGTICIDEGVRHVFRTPIKGDGELRKTGAGELVIGVGKKLDGTESTPTTVLDSGIPTAQWTGQTTVAAGRLTFEETESVGARSFVLAEGATLDLGGYSGELSSVAGTGKIANAYLSKVRILAPRPGEEPAIPEFDVSSLGQVVVDFGIPKSEKIERPTELVPVARLGGSVSFVSTNWRARNCGAETSATFSCSGGVVYAKFTDKPGILLIVR